MGRKKVRHFKSKQYYEDMFNTYFQDNKNEVVADLMDTLGYTDFEEMREDEYNSKWGFDCGWTLLSPKDRAMYHEWELDNGKYCCASVLLPTEYDTSAHTG